MDFCANLHKDINQRAFVQEFRSTEIISFHLQRTTTIICICITSSRPPRRFAPPGWLASARWLASDWTVDSTVDSAVDSAVDSGRPEGGQC